MWPIVNSEIIKFRDENRQRVFDEALGWILSLDDICDRNRELGKYLENLVADDCMDFSWLERLMITGNQEGVGEYIIYYLVEHFGIFKKLSEAMAIFTAACMGASEKSEILPLEKFANEIRDTKGYKKSSGDLLNKAMDLAREKVKIVEFQRKNIYD